MIRPEDKDIANEHPKGKKVKVERIEIASTKGPLIPIDIGKMLLLERLAKEGKFDEIKKLKGPMKDYLRPSYRKGLRKK